MLSFIQNEELQRVDKAGLLPELTQQQKSGLLGWKEAQEADAALCHLNCQVLRSSGMPFHVAVVQPAALGLAWFLSSGPVLRTRGSSAPRGTSA